MFSTVCGEAMSAKIKCWSSYTVSVPLCDKCGFPSGSTLDTKPSFIFFTKSITSVDIAEIIFKFFHFNGNITVSVLVMYARSVYEHFYFVNGGNTKVYFHNWLKKNGLF